MSINSETTPTAGLASPTVFLETSGNIRLFAKLETIHPTGSFKHRGASNKLKMIQILHPSDLDQGIYAASAGNHAQGVARATAELGYESYIYVPETAPQRKIDAIVSYGGHITVVAGGFDDALYVAQQNCEKAHGVFIHPFDDLDVINGQAGVAEEIASEKTFYDRVFVPVGGGGLLAGTLNALANQRPTTKVYGVQLEGSDAFTRSYEAKKLIELDTVNVLSDGTAVKKVGRHTLAAALNSPNFGGCIVVSNPELYSAMLRQDTLIDVEAEAAGTLAYAGMLKVLKTKASPHQISENWVSIVSGCHRDAKLFKQLAMSA